MTNNNNNESGSAAQPRPEEQEAPGDLVRNAPLTTDDVHQTLAFSSDILGTESGLPTQDMPMDAPVRPADLGDFLARPVKIYDLSWAAGAVAVKIDPWALFLNNVNVQRKLYNFKLLRGTLRVRFVVNGTPFHYGCILANYEPRVGLVRTGLGEFTRHSQMPHVLVTPTANASHELTCPFVHPLQWIDLQETDGAQVGVVMMQTLNLLKMSNEVTPSPVTVSVFAWMEDAEMRIPTIAAPATFIPQSDERDETGPISTVASAVANVAGNLEGVPIIGRFATAAQVGASAVSSIAKMFGWSRPLQMEPAVFVKQLPVAPLALSVWTESATPITLDPKQSLTIDSAVTGADFGDELALSNLTRIWSYVDSFTWDTSDATESVLYSMPVQPLRVPGGALTNGTAYELSALAFGAFPMTFWSGAMEYRLKFVASAYHRGRVRLTFEPNHEPYNADSTNTTYTQVIDLADADDVTFSIHWSQAEPYKPLEFELIGSPDVPSTENGKWYVTVLNDLTAPLAGQGIEVQVWVRGGDNMDFIIPRSEFKTYSVLSPDSYVPQSDDTETQMELDLFGIATVDTPGKTITMAGEKYSSLRQFARRSTAYHLLRSITEDSYAGGTGRMYTAIIRHFPQPFGSYATAPDTTTTNNAFNYAGFSYLPYIAEAFLGVKGSVVWRLVPSLPQTANSIFINRYEENNEAEIGSQAFTSADSRDEMRSWHTGRIPMGGAGGLHLVTKQSGVGLEVVSPGYNSVRFNTNVGYKGRFHGEQFDGLFAHYSLELGMPSGTTSTSYNNVNTIQTYVSAGEDFQVNFFMGAPTLYEWTVVQPPKV